MAFVSNGAWLDGNAQDGFRKSIENEFSKVYVLTCEATVGQVENFVKKKPAMCLDLVAVHQLQ